MRLVRVKIKNFRSIRQATIEFSVSLRALFGLNEAGKSNILKALRLLDSNYSWDPSDVRTISLDETDESGEVVFEYKFSDEEIDKLMDDLKLKIISGPRRIVAVEKKDEYTLKKYICTVRPVSWVSKMEKLSTTCYEHSPNLSDSGRWLTLKDGSQPTEITVDGQTVTVEAGMLVHATMVVPEGHSNLVPANKGAFFEVVQSAASALAEARTPPCVYWAYRQEFLLPGKIDLATFIANPSTCIPLRNIFALADYNNPAASLAAVEGQTNGSRNLLNRVARIATDHLHKVWKEHSGISLQLTMDGPNILAVVQDHENVFDFERRSDGFKRFVAFLFTVSSQVKAGKLSGALILIDEPDISLHPSGTRLLRKELAELAKNNWVVVSSHSIFMVDANKMEEHLIVKKSKEITTIEPVDRSQVVDEEVIFQAMGTSVFEFLKEKNILFEGWKDKLLFRIGLKKLKAKSTAEKKLSAVGFTHAQGVKDISKIAGILELAQRQFVVVSDADNTAKQHQLAWDHVAPWFCYDDIMPLMRGCTAEDFLTEARLNKVLEVWAAKQDDVKFENLHFTSGSLALALISEWLRNTTGWDKSRTKDALVEIKDALFHDLQPGHISEEYVKLLEALEKKIP